MTEAKPDCTICGLDEAAHKGMRHAYSPEEGAGLTVRSDLGQSDAPTARKGAHIEVFGDAQPRPGEAPVRGRGGDPVLRALLVGKGLISSEELHQAEKELRDSGILVVTERVEVPVDHARSGRGDNEAGASETAP